MVTSLFSLTSALKIGSAPVCRTASATK